jgi:hypothetical protein
MMTEYDSEPIPGLPGMLPPGEQILWQGAPDARALARSAFHTRLITGYFAALSAVALGFALSGSGYTGVIMTVALGVVGVGLLHALAQASARTTLYTLTNRRIVLRVGIALPKCINLPLGLVGSVDLAPRADGNGDVALTVIGKQRLGYLALWPHARPWKLAAPQPMLRALPEAATVASLIARTCLAAHPEGRIAQPDIRVPLTPAFAEAAAA